MYEMSRQITSFMAENPNKIPTAKDLVQMDRSAVTPTFGVSTIPVYDTFVQISRDVEKNYPDKTHRDYGTTLAATKAAIAANV